MKFLKFLVVCAISTFSISASAAISAQATIKITADDSEFADAINIYQDAAQTDKTNDIPNTIDANYCVNMYVVEGANNYSSYQVADLSGVKFIFVANKEEEAYTMSFSDVTGFIALSNADTSFVIDATKDYKFTCAKSATIEFTISMPYIRPVTAGQWGTICYPKSITSVTGGTLYSLTNATATVVNAELATIPTTAGKAYVFKADAAATQLVMANTGDDASLQTTHGLVGTFEDTTTPAGAYGIMGNYVVEVKEGNALLANRAYIKMSDLTSPTAPKRGHAIFMISNTPTGMDLIDAETAKDGKMMINGQLIIIRDGKMFNAQGAAL